MSLQRRAKLSRSQLHSDVHTAYNTIFDSESLMSDYDGRSLWDLTYSPCSPVVWEVTETLLPGKAIQSKIIFVPRIPASMTSRYGTRLPLLAWPEQQASPHRYQVRSTLEIN